MRTIAIGGLLLGLFALCGCQSEPEPAAPATAPVSGGAAPPQGQGMSPQGGNAMASQAAAAAAAEKAARAKAGQ